MTRRRWVALLLLLLTVAGVGGWSYFRPREDPQLAALDQMRQQMMQNRENSTPEQRQADWQNMRNAMDQLSDAQRQEAMQRARQGFMQMMERRMEEFFALPPEQRNDWLDKEIDAMEARRKEWEAARARGEDPGRGFGPPAGPPGGGEGRDRDGGNRSQNSNAEKERGESGRGGRSSGGPPGGGNAGDRRKERIDSIPAETRARFQEFGRAVQQRRSERGLPPMPGPFGGR